MRHLLLATLALVLCAPPPAAAQQETATIIGTVVDAQKGTLPGATVTAKNVNTGFIRSAVTEQDGRYRLAAVPPGSYEIAAEMQGFGRALRRGVTLTVGAEAVINFEMAVAGVTEQVTVEADTPVIETTTSAVQSTLGREQIDLLERDGYKGWVSLETHWPGPGGDKHEASMICGRKLIELVN